MREGAEQEPAGGPPHPLLLPALTDVLGDKGHKAAADAPGMDGCDVEHVGHNGKHLDVWDGAGGGLWCRLEAGPALPLGSHAEPRHRVGAMRVSVLPAGLLVPWTPSWGLALDCVTLEEPFTPTLQSPCVDRGSWVKPHREMLRSRFQRFLEHRHSSLRIPTFQSLFSNRKFYQI